MKRSPVDDPVERRTTRAALVTTRQSLSAAAGSKTIGWYYKPRIENNWYYKPRYCLFVDRLQIGVFN